jgi:hypothetical protein
MKILACDPGNKQSAFVIYQDGKVLWHTILPNANALLLLDDPWFHADPSGNGLEWFCIEMIASMGMAVGAEVFETVFWIGRFVQCWKTRFKDKPYFRVYRKETKMHLCGSMRAKDGNIRQAIMDRYGSTREAALGTKKKPGPLYGIRKDEWSALAVAIYSHEVLENT